MTEPDWLAFGDSLPMLKYLRGRASDRKLRLFACACCRRVWGLLPGDPNRALVAAVEGRPAGAFDDPGLHEALLASSSQEHEWGSSQAYWAVKYLGRSFYKLDPLSAAVEVVFRAARAAEDEGGGAVAAERAAQAGLLRDIFGNRFCPVAFDSAWLSWNGGTVRALAQVAYDERTMPDGTLDPARLAVLADALEEAGCADAEILSHLRGPGPHVLGCWAVDLLLAKE
jgi:hypothetical protein